MLDLFKDVIDVAEARALNQEAIKFNGSSNLLLKLATKPCDQVVKIANKGWYTASLKLSYVLQVGSNLENVVQTVSLHHIKLNDIVLIYLKILLKNRVP